MRIFRSGRHAKPVSRWRIAFVILCGVAGLAGLVVSGGKSAGASSAGSVYAWLDNHFGQLGNGTTTNSSIPVASAMPAGTTSTAVAAGRSHTLAVTSTGAVYAWGNGGHGQLGNGSTANVTTPVKSSLPAGVTATTAAAGWDQSLAVTSTGALYAWGYNAFGELGIGTTKNSTVPVLVHLPAGVSVTAVAAGQYHNLAVTSTGALYAWGSNSFGQLGNGTTVSSTVPVQVTLPAGVKATAVGAGDSHSLVVTSAGAVYAWGKNTFGQLGNGTTTGSDVPVLVALPAGVTATSVAAGGVSSASKVPEGDYSLALASTGAVYAWGANGTGQLGTGNTTSSNVPVLTQLPAGVTGTAIGAGPNYGHALTSSGDVYFWGTDSAGHHQHLVPAPTALPTGLHGAAVSAGPDGNQIAAIMVGSATVASLTLSPATATISPGGAQTYTATGYDASGHSLGDVTASTTFTVTNGTCTGNSCTSSTPGNQTVTGKDGSATGTATLTVSTGPQWSAQAVVPQAVTGAGGAATSLNGELWVAWHALNDQVGYAFYNPTTATWSSQAFHPQALSHDSPGITALNGKLYVVWNSSASTTNLQLAVSSYDPTTASWTPIVYDAQVLTQHDAAVAVVNGKLWVAYSASTNNQIGYVSYDPTTNSWSAPALQPQATTAHRPGLAAIGTTLYLDWHNLSDLVQPSRRAPGRQRAIRPHDHRPVEHRRRGVDHQARAGRLRDLQPLHLDVVTPGVPPPGGGRQRPRAHRGGGQAHLGVEGTGARRARVLVLRLTDARGGAPFRRDVRATRCPGRPGTALMWWIQSERGGAEPFDSSGLGYNWSPSPRRRWASRAPARSSAALAV
jgi:alpha-tubulin suppressor-like RCC1 family protein